MKTGLNLLIAFMLLLTACGSNQSKSSDESIDSTVVVVQSAGEIKAMEEAKNCDEFIDKYEKWMNDYIAFIDEYQKTPLDATLMEKYLTVAEESMNWITQWNGKLIYCASKEKYQKRFEEISNKAEEKLKEMGMK